METSMQDFINALPWTDISEKLGEILGMSDITFKKPEIDEHGGIVEITVVSTNLKNTSPILSFLYDKVYFVLCTEIIDDDDGYSINGVIELYSRQSTELMKKIGTTNWETMIPVATCSVFQLDGHLEVNIRKY